MTKSELRKKYKSLRKPLSLDDIEDYSLSIANQLLKLDIWDKSFYHIFLTIEEQKEINTEYILNILAGKDKNIVISKSNFEDFSMTHYLLTDSTTIKKNNYNIPEPIDGIPIASEQLEVVFVPLLAFDKTGNRVGYGKGFYDRFLKQCKPETIKIGLSFFEAETENFEAVDNDVKLDYCVTPNHIFQF
ncbi:5-formyltetrahydrofolate cyclo-ligase [Winogradskyella sp. MIT101101]|uniref:5-formyltetrahydrofolate cyclo-ligase n=1 Tax=Winogradskyella sp. MIT101101 TaxID=3098297 RepID=UPI00399C0993